MRNQELRGPASIGIRDIAQYADFQAGRVAQLRALGRQITIADDALVPVAYVNEGRWLVDCVCNNGLLTGPDWQVAFCDLCGRRFQVVTFPRFWQAIEAVLVPRLLNHQHWHEPETVGELLAENQAHGL